MVFIDHEAVSKDHGALSDVGSAGQICSVVLLPENNTDVDAVTGLSSHLVSAHRFTAIQSIGASPNVDIRVTFGGTLLARTIVRNRLEVRDSKSNNIKREERKTI
ncbi:MAG: hypothetical protein AAF434_20225 [Pseudomonadota bacterium]